MASTNKTTNLELSQYVSSDKPTYLVDYNSDMAKIDTGVHTAQVTADTASTAATNAQTTAEGAQTTATTAITNAATADTKATTANTNIGTLANLTTTDKTSLVNAINEVNGKDLIETSLSQSTNKAYACSYVNSELAKKEDMPLELWYNASGSTGNISISGHSLDEFEYIEIFSEMGILDVFKPGQSSETTISNVVYIDRLYYGYARYNIQNIQGGGISISPSSVGEYYDGSNHPTTNKIYKVVGHYE